MRALTVSQRIFASFALIIAIMLGMSVTFYLRAVSNHETAALALSSDLAGMGLAAKSRLTMSDHFLRIQELLRVAQANSGPKGSQPKIDKAALVALETSTRKVYDQYVLTIVNQAEREGAAELVKAPHDLLDLLEQGKTVQAETFNTEKLKPLWDKAREQINRLLGTRVHLNLHVKVMKEWQRDAKYLNRLGF